MEGKDSFITAQGRQETAAIVEDAAAEGNPKSVRLVLHDDDMLEKIARDVMFKKQSTGKKNGPNERS